MEQTLRVRRQLILVAAAACVLLVAFMVYHNSRFHIVSTNPSLGKVATVTPFLRVSFNKTLQASAVRATSTPDKIVKNVAVNGKTATVNLIYPLSLKTYTILITATATDGEHITNKKLVFTAQNIDSTTLPSDQHQAIINNQDQHQGASTDAIVSHLPYNNSDFILSATVNSQGSLELDAKLYLSQSDMTNEDAAVATYKKEVTDYISSLGLDPSKYNIVYTLSTPENP